MSEENVEYDALNKTSKYLDVQLNSVDNIIQYVINKTQLSNDEVLESQKRAQDMIEHLEDNTKYLGELLLTVCFCYDGALRTMLAMVREKIKPASEMNLDEIAAEVFQTMKSEGTKH
jgi:undecaprenyl pyrophosphate synthase